MGKVVLSFLMAMILLCSVYTIAQEQATASQLIADEFSSASFQGSHRAAPGSNMQSMHQSRNSRIPAPGNFPDSDEKNGIIRQPAVVVQDSMLYREELADFLKWNAPRMNGISYFQEYVTPYDDVITSYLEEEGLEDKYSIYQAAVSWIWVSDMTLTGKQETWLYPSQFLYETPSSRTNPVPGAIVSDCEDQANALASLLIASGEYDESTVRVAVGEVSLSGMSGGHAWVEVYENDDWFPLDPTIGPYYDDEAGCVAGTDESNSDFYYFRDRQYSVKSLWYYYNNEYFIDMVAGKGNAPDSWKAQPSSYF
ncbi:transglutaminase domain-containing protein [Methanolobus chelungpuianus]|uniref:transglutaminase domain-containing protein n=1 Tax=Methanolobus chelungpuianus TaxID=502115 RepID=UPI002113FCA9|nr:hypothetical protein [Methanolobus chelungpuianus]